MFPLGKVGAGGLALLAEVLGRIVLDVTLQLWRFSVALPYALRLWILSKHNVQFDRVRCQLLIILSSCVIA